MEILFGDRWDIFGYPWISYLDIFFRRSLWEYRRDILNLQRSPRISHHIRPSPRISEDIQWGELPDVRIRLPAHERTSGRSQSGGSHNSELDRLANRAQVGPAASEHLPQAVASVWDSYLTDSNCQCWYLVWHSSWSCTAGLVNLKASQIFFKLVAPARDSGPGFGAAAAARLPVRAADSGPQRPRQSSWVRAGGASGWAQPVRPVAPACQLARLEDPAQCYIAQDIVVIIVGIIVGFSRCWPMISYITYDIV
jgi:hypothetical protein